MHAFHIIILVMFSHLMVWIWLILWCLRILKACQSAKYVRKTENIACMSVSAFARACLYVCMRIYVSISVLFICMCTCVCRASLCISACVYEYVCMWTCLCSSVKSIVELRWETRMIKISCLKFVGSLIFLKFQKFDSKFFCACIISLKLLIYY